VNHTVGRRSAGLSVTTGCDRQGKPSQQLITSSIPQGLLLELMVLGVFAKQRGGGTERSLRQSLGDAGWRAVVSAWRVAPPEPSQTGEMGWQGLPRSAQSCQGTGSRHPQPRPGAD